MSIATSSESPPNTALSQVCSAAPDVFVAEVWGHRAWLSRAEDLNGHVADVFSPRAADELLSTRGLRTPFLRMAKDGTVIPQSHYTGSGGAGARIADQVHDDAVLRLFSDGATVVLQGLHRTWAPVGALAAELTAELGHPVQVNAYITPAQSQGFAAHYDTHDVFVLQVSGSKRWRVHEPVLPAPMPEENWQQRAAEVRARAEQPPVIEADLLPGDCLYLPRGFLHSATAHGETSIHLTFGVHASTERDVLEAAWQVVRASGWRSALPAGWDPASTDGLARLGELIESMRDALTRVDAQTLAATLSDLRALEQRPEPVPPLAQAADIANLTADTVVRLRRWLSVRWSDDGLVAAGRAVRVEPEDRAAVEVLLRGGPCQVGLLPGTADGPPFALIAGLLREGVLVTDTL
ncbi:MAG: cupin domain-containing protein [Candidatus Nanopelagicales bacterium]